MVDAEHISEVQTLNRSDDLNYLAPMLRLGQSHFMMRIDEMVREGQERRPKHNVTIPLDKNSYKCKILG